jgi:hypothetical protein
VGIGAVLLDPQIPMATKRWLRLFAALCLLLTSCLNTGVTPKLTLSPEKVHDRGRVEIQGTGFTPKSIVKSHLRRPNDTEFPVLSFLTDDKGRFTHSINTELMLVGIHEVWVIDSTGVSSNVANFEVIPDEK